MGRIKDQLLDEPPTIGDLRRQGAVGILVRCVLPCRHLAAVKFDHLELPDDTLYPQITELKRLRCTYCDRVAKSRDLAVDRGPLAGWGMIPKSPKGPLDT